MNKIAKVVVLSATALSLIGTVSMADGAKRGDRDGMKRFEQMDTNADGFVTKEELQAKRAEHFAKTDANNDGFLSVDEMAEGMSTMGKGMMGQKGMMGKGMMGKGMMDASDNMKARMLRFMDENGDGKVAIDEMPTDGMDNMFTRLDADKDGKISKEEMSDMQGKKGKNGMKRGHDDDNDDG